MPDCVVRDSLVQVRPITLMWGVSIELPQQQLCTFMCEVLEVRIFLWGGHAPPPHTDNLFRFPPWGLFVPVPFLSLI